MDNAEYVLIGVALTVLLNAMKEWYFQKSKNKKELEYLAIRISCILDTFANGCFDIVADDGLSHGSLDQDECRSIQIKTPIFDLLSVEVEWKTLPAEIMYELLSFPNLIETSNRNISAAFEYSASPPDYEEGFEERQLQYATLGLKAHGLSSKLRSIGHLPPLNTHEEWSPVFFMKENLDKLQKERAERNREFMRNLNASA